MMIDVGLVWKFLVQFEEDYLQIDFSHFLSLSLFFLHLHVCVMTLCV